MQNVRPSIFIGSSVEGLPILEALNVLLDRSCEVVPWTTLFEPSEFTLESLETRIDDFDFGCMILTPDDVTQSRGKMSQSPRDNLILELGLIIGSLGRKRSFAVCNRGAKTKLPTDLAGFNLLAYDPPQSGTFESALGATSIKIRNAIERLGVRAPTRKRVG